MVGSKNPFRPETNRTFLKWSKHEQEQIPAYRTGIRPAAG